MITTSNINNIKSILPATVEWINVLSTIYLISTLILPFDYQQPALYAYFTTLGLDIIINQRYKDVKWNNVKWTFVAMILFYLCIWIWHPFEDNNIHRFEHVIEERLPFFVFGILGLFTTINPRLKLEYLALPMLISSIICSSYIFYKTQIHTITPLTFAKYQKLFEYYRHIALNSTHMDFNLYLNFSIMTGFYAIYTFSKKWVKIICLICILIVFCFLFTSEGRVGFFTGNILIISFIIYNITKYNKNLIIPISALSVIFLFIIVTNHQRVKEVPFSKDPRSAIWEHSLEIIKMRPILGYGVDDGRKIFIDYKGKDDLLTQRYLNQFPHIKGTYNGHPHNVFIESTIEFGIIGLILISAIMLLPIILTRGKRQIFITILIFIFGFQACFEVLWMFLPPIYLCWFLYIMLLIPMSEKKEMQQ